MEKSEIYLNSIVSDVNNWLEGYFKNKGTYEKCIYEAMAYSLNAGGKRIRPVLFLLGFSLMGKDYKDVLPLACAIEMIHTYSLIHDDLPSMDNDDLRRGRPTNHKVFGEAIAILAGDGLLNEAMNIMFNYCLGNNTINSISACKTISEAAGVDGMIGGQVIDMESENKKISLEQLYCMHSKKTGALIKASIVAGATAANADEDTLKLLRSYGEKLGLAFQIKDDILDVTGDTTVMGKMVKSDISNNKTTFITEYGLDRCQEICSSLTEDCMENLYSIKGDTEAMEHLTLYLLNRDR
ncbi:MAG: polyprenyl synthetase family protein [Solirubrobacterales bacterium]